MSDLPATSGALPQPVESWLPGPKPPDEGWSRKKFFLVLLFVFAFHVALIILFGTKKYIIPRPVTNVPQLQLVNSGDDLIALNDPTLFARPNPHDVVTPFWRQVPAISQPNFNWTEAPRYLDVDPTSFGAAFAIYMRTNESSEFVLNLKPAPHSFLPEVTLDTAPDATSMRISGELLQRRLLNADSLQLIAIGDANGFAYAIPSLLMRTNDVIGQSKIQALVDTAGNVTSAVVVKDDPSIEADSDSDQRALQFVRSLSFAPGPNVTFGDITFTWHTVATNALPAPVP